jgi:predicted phosphodiesterase
MTRYAILADIHGNLEALKAVIKDVAQEQKRVDEIWFLGDVVVYGPDPRGCLDYLEQKVQRWPQTAVMGNNDLAVAYSYSEEDVVDRWKDVGGAVDSEESKATKISHAWTVRVLGDEYRQKLLKLQLGPRIMENNIVLVHASPCEPVGYTGNYLDTVEDAEEAFWCLQDRGLNTPLCLFAHTHKATLYRKTSRERIYDNCQRLARDELTGKTFGLDDTPNRLGLLVNPGSVGQPRDGDRRAAYAILDTGAGKIEFYRVEYPWQETIRCLQECDLPGNTIDVLTKRLTEGQ